jgi:hypothetical protein
MNMCLFSVWMKADVLMIIKDGGRYCPPPGQTEVPGQIYNLLQSIL